MGFFCLNKSPLLFAIGIGKKYHVGETPFSLVVSVDDVCLPEETLLSFLLAAHLESRMSTSV